MITRTMTNSRGFKMGESTWGVPPPTPPGKFEGRTHKVYMTIFIFSAKYKNIFYLPLLPTTPDHLPHPPTASTECVRPPGGLGGGTPLLEETRHRRGHRRHHGRFCFRRDNRHGCHIKWRAFRCGGARSACS